MTTAALSPEQRTEDLQRLGKEEFDVLVVGGGVTGAGAALDAATRGLRVAVVEAQDWASGTSSRSTKLIHGGLRYLEMLDFHLVHQALVERGLLLQVVAPHLVHPVPILYPLRTPVVERAYVGAGIALYDALGWSTGSSRGLPLHRHLSRRAALALAPGLRRDSLAGAIEYYDAQVDDARFVAELVRTAATYGATAVSRAAVVDVRRSQGRVTGALVRDAETGSEIEVRAAVTLLATGPWTEDTESLAGRSRAVRVRPSKGAHLVVDQSKIDSTVGLVVRTEKSVLFALPWHEHWLIGTTDTEWDHEKARPVTTSVDVEYLLEHVNRVLERPLGTDDVEAVYAGLRPLVAGIGVVRGPGEQGAERLDRMANEEPPTTKVSREHAVARPAPGLVVVSGGKYTTYRVMAADAVDAAVEDLGRADCPSVTRRVRLVGAEQYEARRAQRELLARRHGIPVAKVDHLLDRYGGLADEVLDLIAGAQGLGTEVPDGAGYLQAEVVYAVTHEGARHLDDILLRRTRIGIETHDAGLAAAKSVADLAGPLLGWDSATADAEVEAYRQTAELEYLGAVRPVDDTQAVARTQDAAPLFALP
jgi:glycerol-3-phosphate dehydrogenase